MSKTYTATCTIYPPHAAGTVTVNTDLTVTTNPIAPLYTDRPCRLQVLNAQDAVNIIGDQAQSTVTYLVVLDTEVNAPHKSVIHVTACDDPTFVDRRLSVRKMSRGSVVWERDLYAIDDLTAPTTS